MKNVNEIFSINIISIFNVFFLLLVIFLISERFICNYGLDYIGKSIVNICHISFLNESKIWLETGFVENLQSFLLFMSILILFYSLKSSKLKGKFVYYFILIQCLGLIYFLGEEISWGQHFFKWESPDFFIEVNNQKETNIHNISNLFNELPRTLVLVWCCFSILFLLLFKNFIKVNEKLNLIICPNKQLIYISLFLIVVVLPDLIVDKFELSPTYVFSFNNPNEVISYVVGENPPTIETKQLKTFYEKISLNFFRLSELHELIFSYYFFIYSMSLKKILRN